jgi:hypothetical protein
MSFSHVELHRIARVFFLATLYHFILDVHIHVGTIQCSIVEHPGAILMSDEGTARNKFEGSSQLPLIESISREQHGSRARRR